MDLNKVMIIGRLTQDPESKTTPQGTPVTSFSIATNRTWKDQNGNQQSKTEYHNIVAWRRLAEIVAQYLSKGRQVYIEGYLQTRSWDGQDGQKRYRTEIVADNMIMLGNRGENAGAPAENNYQNQQSSREQPQQEMATAGPASEEEIRIEDIPF